MDNRPIGIFDSGLGGLTVLKEYLKELPNENYIYFGDNARVPYGSKSQETIIQYAREIVSFLIQKDVKMIIIACGTASANAFETLKSEFSIPIQTVIEPTAMQIKENKVGVIATKSTIASKAWEKAIHHYHPDCQVYSKACPLFVPIVEENLTNTEISKLVISTYLQEFITWQVESLILGCTHYPLLQSEIQNFLPSTIKLINVNIATVEETKQYLAQHDALCMDRKTPEIFAYTTDCPEIFQKSAEDLFSISFHKIEKVVL